MPTYQYACTTCNHRFEAVQSFADGSLTECPACSGSLRKVFSSVGIVFKGSGFYRTDSRAGAIPKGETKSESSSSNSNTSSAGSTATKNSAPSAPSSASPTPSAAAS